MSIFSFFSCSVLTSDRFALCSGICLGSQCSSRGRSGDIPNGPPAGGMPRPWCQTLGARLGWPLALTTEPHPPRRLPLPQPKQLHFSWARDSTRTCRDTTRSRALPLGTAGPGCAGSWVASPDHLGAAARAGRRCNHCETIL